MNRLSKSNPKAKKKLILEEYGSDEELPEKSLLEMDMDQTKTKPRKKLVAIPKEDQELLMFQKGSNINNKKSAILSFIEVSTDQTEAEKSKNPQTENHDNRQDVYRESNRKIQKKKSSDKGEKNLNSNCQL